MMLSPLEPEEASSQQRRLIERGEHLVRQMWPDITVNAFALPDDDAVLLVQPERGGASLYIAADESVMFAASSLEPGAALELFRSGRRTDPVEFVPHAPGRSAR
ncbi:hypothetical protein KZC51_04225 [Microbacterium sp. SSW1-49]|uniref:Uncharacterized protein n=1 Tax=Microbacterium croceum TaxID=2851645 RepID=A0ABT0FBB1_9MICO|nr:hypothetical protein [Microbacterium croceum]MCK2035336.1 hypothetical protein [Microbacterium croceum]